MSGYAWRVPRVCAECRCEFSAFIAIWAGADPYVPGIGDLCDVCNEKRLAEEGQL